MVRPALAAGLALALAAAAARADDLDIGLARATCDVAGRTIDLAVTQIRAEAPGSPWTVVQRTAEACLRGDDVPTVCLSAVAETEQVALGDEPAERSHAIRCVAEGRSAWVVGTRWSPAGLDARALRLDLRALTSAPVVEVDGHPEVQPDPELPLAPDAAWTWSSATPVPSEACTALSMDLQATDRALDIVYATTGACAGVKLHLDAALGGWSSSPVPPARSSSGVERGAGIRVSGRATAAARSPRPRRPVGGGGLSFSRR